MPEDGKEKPPNLVLEAAGESKQVIGVRVANDLLLAIHKELAAEKQRARDEDLQEPNLTWMVERFLLLGLHAHQEAKRRRSA